MVELVGDKAGEPDKSADATLAEPWLEIEGESVTKVNQMSSAKIRFRVRGNDYSLISFKITSADLSATIQLSGTF